MVYQSRGMKNLEKAAKIRKISTGILAAGWFGGIYYICDSLGASPVESLAVTSLLGPPTYMLAYVIKETILDTILGPRERYMKIDKGSTTHTSTCKSTPNYSSEPANQQTTPSEIDAILRSFHLKTAMRREEKLKEDPKSEIKRRIEDFQSDDFFK